jgi:hypothetical protein
MLGFWRGNIFLAEVAGFLKHIDGCENVGIENSEQRFEVDSKICEYEAHTDSCRQLKLMKVRIKKQH